jgi:hypothetical protein
MALGRKPFILRVWIVKMSANNEAGPRRWVGEDEVWDNPLTG